MITHPRDDIFSTHDIRTQQFYVEEFQSIRQFRGGSVIPIELAPPRWRGEWVSIKMPHWECMDLQAMLTSLRGSLHGFFATDTRRWRPRKAKVDFADTGSIGTLNTADRTISLTGLPPDLGAQVTIARQDLVSVAYTRDGESLTSILEVAEDAQVFNDGDTAVFEVTTPIPNGVQVADAVKLFDPPCLMQLEPNSVRFNDTGSSLGTVSFKAWEFRP